MINLVRRSYQKELMDRDDIPFADMAQTLRELNIINTRLGGHAITLKGVQQIQNAKFKIQNAPLTVCEIGCGGGDNLFAVFKCCLKKRIPVRFVGIDMNAECIAFAKQQYPDLPCEWICSDYAKVDLSHTQPDIIFSSLFCHHFTDEQLVSMLQWLQRNSRLGFFINDLQRHWLAYYLIKYITKFFSRSYLVRNDACISVARGFRKEEWFRLFREAGLLSSEPGVQSQQSEQSDKLSISWKWAFRYLVIYKQ